MEEFISDSPIKMPAMKVKVTDKDNNLIESFDAPAGFRMEMFVAKLYPYSAISTSFPVNKDGDRDFLVQVWNCDEEIVKTYTGVYQEKIADL
jgi:hypothetical protein